MSHWVRAFAAKSDDINLIPKIHKVGRERRLPKAVLYLHWCTMIYAHPYNK